VTSEPVPIRWWLSTHEAELIARIVERAVQLYGSAELDRRIAFMDITACHCNGMPLHLAQLLAANNYEFSHDVAGITRHIDRETGKLTGCFVPRFALANHAVSRVGKSGVDR
jgi:hypothetical protein